MKITVEHEIPCDKGKEFTCQYAGDFWGNPICRYHTHRHRTHGRKAPMERNVPKRTCLWLKNLPNLEPTYHGSKPDNAAMYGVTPSGKVRVWEDSVSRSAKVRSKTFPGIARAMAEQWGGICDG